jgi:hypothetical protein
VLAYVTITAAGCRRPQMVPGVDPAPIRSITIGMTEQQVTAMFGPPLEVLPSGDARVLWHYAIPGWPEPSARFWVIFDRGAVHTVQVKRYPFFGDDYAVYELRPDQTFESPDFESTFARAR